VLFASLTGVSSVHHGSIAKLSFMKREYSTRRWDVVTVENRITVTRHKWCYVVHIGGAPMWPSFCRKKQSCWICAQQEAKHMSRCYRVNVRCAFADCCSLMYGQMKSSEGKLFVQPHGIASDSPQGTTVCCLFVHQTQLLARTYFEVFNFVVTELA